MTIGEIIACAEQATINAESNLKELETFPREIVLATYQDPLKKTEIFNLYLAFNKNLGTLIDIVSNIKKIIEEAKDGYERKIASSETLSKIDIEFLIRETIRKSVAELKLDKERL